MTEIFAVVQGLAQRFFEKARAEGRREPEEAYLADGLLAAARAAAAAAKAGANPEPSAEGPKSKTAPAANTEPPGTGATPRSTDDASAPPVNPSKIVVRIDWDSLVRGFPIGDEVCDIAGVGPIAVSTVRAMIASGDVFLAAVVTKGVDVVNVAHLGRRSNAHQRSGLDWLNPTCTVRGCNASVRLQIDHRQDWAHTKITLLSLLDGLCKHHHGLKTYKGWALVAGTGKRPMVPRSDPRHPEHASPGPSPPGVAEVA